MKNFVRGVYDGLTYINDNCSNKKYKNNEVKMYVVKNFIRFVQIYL